MQFLDFAALIFIVDVKVVGKGNCLEYVSAVVMHDRASMTYNVRASGSA